MTLTLDTNVTAAKRSVNWTNNPEALAALKEFKSLKAIEKAGADAEKRRKEVVEPLLRTFLNGASEAIVRGNVVVRESSERTTNLYDYKTLAEAFPEAYEAVHTVSKYTFLQTL